MSSENTDEDVQGEVQKSENEPEQSESSSSSDSDSDSESDTESEAEEAPLAYTRPDGTIRQLRKDNEEDVNSAEANVRQFMGVLNSKGLRRAQEKEDKNAEYPEDQYNFPPDPEDWREEDLKEMWADAPVGMTKPGWDPHDVDEEEVEILNDEIADGRIPPIQPFYVPYRKPYPVIPDEHYDIPSAKAVIHEMDRIEEFLIWGSYIFPDGSSYEGTVWDDRAHGKGVFVAEQGLVRYEGEWLQNDMDGHGVVEVDIPVPEPIPGSKLEAKMRAEGGIFSSDFMPPEDKKWLEMDVEDSLVLADGEYEVPFYENDEWIRQFGQKPEKGRYRYAGQWKHGRMHGCGVYQVNERTTWGRFYFGELLEDSTGCGVDICAMHAGIAEVAAAKARMFVNKPDGMVREYYGPFGDPQHAYFYEEDDVWMAPGFINQFHEVPDNWKTYAEAVDKERETWLNSFYKAPLRLPMPAELEYWWSTYEKPEFVLVNSDPVRDPSDPSKLIYTEDPYILHTPTGRLIDFVEDEEHGVRLFWKADEEDGEENDQPEPELLPLGFDEFYGENYTVPDTMWISFLKSVHSKLSSLHERLQKTLEEKKRASELRIEHLNEQLEPVKDGSTMKDEIAVLDEKLKQMQEDAEKKVEQEIDKEDAVSVSEPVKDEEEEEEEEEEEAAPSSFGSIDSGVSSRDDKKRNNSGGSSFASSSLLFASPNLFSSVPSKLQAAFQRWKSSQSPKPSNGSVTPSSSHAIASSSLTSCSRLDTVSFPREECKILNLKLSRQTRISERRRALKMMPRNQRNLKGFVKPAAPASEDLGILSLHTPFTALPHL